MKISVSLPDDDVVFLDSIVGVAGYPSRSAVLHRAVTILRAGDLVSAYEDAFAEWIADGDDEAWDPARSDGLAGTG